MSLWLNKKEREYLMEIIGDDMDYSPEQSYISEKSWFEDKEPISVEGREKLWKKIRDMQI